MQNFASVLKILKAMDREDSDFQSHYTAKASELQAEITILEQRIEGSDDSRSAHNYCHEEKMNSAKRELAARLREILILWRLHDNTPSPSELIQCRFQGAITHTAGRMKLVDSMEEIVKGTQQKVEKVRVKLQSEQKVCDALKERYATSIAEQRRCYSLLEAFQVHFL